MKRLGILALSAMLAAGLASSPGSAVAQQKSLKEQLVGTWILVSCDMKAAEAPLEFGNNPLGQFIFTANGRFAFQVATEIPKIASGDDKKTTPEEERAVTHGSVAYFGSYTATDEDKTIHLHIERSSFPNLSGTDRRRIVTALSADAMNWTNPARFGGGVINCTTGESSELSAVRLWNLAPAGDSARFFRARQLHLDLAMAASTSVSNPIITFSRVLRS
jgi:hypothetical protein